MTCHKDNNSIFSNSIKIENTNLSLEITVFKTGTLRAAIIFQITSLHYSLDSVNATMANLLKLLFNGIVLHSV